MSDRKLKKLDIADEIYSQVKDVTRKQILVIIDSFFEQILKGIREDKIIELRGLGTFEVKLRRARKKVRNPKTGDIFEGKDHGVVVFRPGQELKNIAWPMRE